MHLWETRELSESLCWRTASRGVCGHLTACTKFTKNGFSNGNEEKKNRKLSTGKALENL